MLFIKGHRFVAALSPPPSVSHCVARARLGTVFVAAPLDEGTLRAAVFSRGVAATVAGDIA
jgi:hypothetical protein